MLDTVRTAKLARKAFVTLAARAALVWLAGGSSFTDAQVTDAQSANQQDTTTGRDKEIAALVAKYTVAKNCPTSVLAASGISLAECARRVHEAQKTCPRTIADGMPAELDEKQRFRIVSRSLECVQDNVRGVSCDNRATDSAADELWEKIHPKVSPALALQNSESLIAVPRPGGVQRAKVEFHVAIEKPGRGTLQVMDLAGSPLDVDSEAFLTNADIVSVDVVPDARLEYSAIVLHYGPAAAQRLRALTTEHAEGRMAMLVDNEVVAVLRWFMPLDAASMFSNSYSREEALRLAQRIAP